MQLFAEPPECALTAAEQGLIEQGEAQVGHEHYQQHGRSHEQHLALVGDVGGASAYFPVRRLGPRRIKQGRSKYQ